MRKKRTNSPGPKSRWKLRTVRDLARHIGVAEGEILSLVASVDQLYRSWEVAKRSGGTRPIDSPKPRLKQVQKQINDRLLQRTRVHPSAMGGIRGKQLVENAMVHVGRPMLAKFDLKDFFSNITSGQVYDCFVSIGCSPDVARLLTRLTTYKGRIPQGAPTSTMVANLVAGHGEHSLNVRLQGLAKRHDASISTWVDDVSISGPPHIKNLAATVERIGLQSGFVPNSRKRIFMDKENRQVVTGVVVNRKPNIVREERRALRAILHRCKTQGPKAVSNKDPQKLKASLRSEIAYFKSLNPAAGARLQNAFKEIDWCR